MNAILDRLLGITSKLFPDRQVAEVVAELVADWLKRSDAEPTCTVRTGGMLVIASRQESNILLTISQPIYQLDDSAKLREKGGGFSVLPLDSPAVGIEIPLSEISGEK